VACHFEVLSSGCDHVDAHGVLIITRFLKHYFSYSRNVSTSKCVHFYGKLLLQSPLGDANDCLGGQVASLSFALILHPSIQILLCNHLQYCQVGGYRNTTLIFSWLIASYGNIKLIQIDDFPLDS